MYTWTFYTYVELQSRRGNDRAKEHSAPNACCTVRAEEEQRRRKMTNEKSIRRRMLTEKGVGLGFRAKKKPKGFGFQIPKVPKGVEGAASRAKPQEEEGIFNLLPSVTHP